MPSKPAPSPGSAASQRTESSPRRLLEMLCECVRAREFKRTEADQILKLLAQNLQRSVCDDDAAGPLDEALQRNPWLTNRVQKLRQERRDLQDSLRSLRSLTMDTEDQSKCPDPLRLRCDEFVERHLEYEATAKNVWEEAFPGPDWIHHDHF